MANDCQDITAAMGALSLGKRLDEALLSTVFEDGRKRLRKGAGSLTAFSAGTALYHAVGTAGEGARKMSGRTWIAEWKRSMGWGSSDKGNLPCANRECPRRATHGAHVQRIKFDSVYLRSAIAGRDAARSRRRWWIVPMCGGCNTKSAEGEFRCRKVVAMLDESADKPFRRERLRRARQE